jgi:hypothetical protein
VLVVFSLVKPNVSAPFFWLALFAPRRWWPALLAVGLYLAATLFALSILDRSVVDAAETFSASTTKMAVKVGQGNLSIWAGMLGLGKYAYAISILTLLALGVWLWRYRKADVWLRIGVTTIVARLWTYHLFYDDVLIVPAMIALLRVARDEAWSDAHRVAAGAVLVLLMCNSVALNPLQALMPFASVFRIGALVLLAYLAHASLKMRSDVEVKEVVTGSW